MSLNNKTSLFLTWCGNVEPFDSTFQSQKYKSVLHKSNGESLSGVCTSWNKHTSALATLRFLPVMQIKLARILICQREEKMERKITTSRRGENRGIHRGRFGEWKRSRGGHKEGEERERMGTAGKAERTEGWRRTVRRREVGVAEKVNNHSLSSLICRLKGLICLLWVCVLACECVCVHDWAKLLLQNQPPDGSTHSQFNHAGLV